MLAIVGRPNVGKSALVNRILGRREAVVEDTPGVTRDRVAYKAEWLDRRFTLVDTGGWEPDAKGINASVAAQAEVAIDLADAVLFVVDANVGATATDEHVVRMLRKTEASPSSSSPTRSTTPVRSPRPPRSGASASASRGPVSALHGRGVADLLDQVLTVLPEVSAVAKEEVGGPRRVAILGRPNVGKSSLLNKAAGEERVVVNELAGTTRDPVDEQVELGGKIWRFVDTAGIRRRVHLQQGADFYASLRTSAALEKAEVAVVLLDVTAADLASRTCASSTSCSSRAARSCSRTTSGTCSTTTAAATWSARSSRTSRHVAWAPRVNISARTGRHLEKLVPALEIALESWDTRIPTGKFNAFLAELTAEHPHPVRGGKQPRILFGTQAASRPPTFVLFTTGFLDPGYRRFIQRRLREIYGFEGTPDRGQHARPRASQALGRP